MKRKIIEIDEEKCTGCGSCIPGCPEGALQVIDGKARLVSDLFCDGLGACIGECPEGAMTITERKAQPYEESKVMANVVKQGENTIKAHLEHLKEHGEMKYLTEAVQYLKQNDVKLDFDPFVYLRMGSGCGSGCPSAAARQVNRESRKDDKDEGNGIKPRSQLGTWPIQLALLTPFASFLDNADLLISADCVPFACASFHREFLKNKVLVMFCPKLDTDKIENYIAKLTHIFQANDIKSITITRMEVPCCGGTIKIVQEALAQSGKEIPIKTHTISIGGDPL